MENKKLSVVLLVRDENEYLPEWLQWHLDQGVEHIFIYDDGRNSRVEDVLGEYEPYCTVRDATRYKYHLQFEAYIDALRRGGDRKQWLAFIDTDEFLSPQGSTSISDVLKDAEGAAALLLPWKVYNADGQMAKEPGLVRERFKQTVDWPYKMPCWKSIVDPQKVMSMAAHSPIKMSDGAYMADTDGNRLEGGNPTLPVDKLVVDHYYTKSYEEWVDRLSRGSCDPFSSRKSEWFTELNPDLAEVVKELEGSDKT